MKKILISVLGIFLVSSIVCTAQNTSHINNPGFGNSSRYTIIHENEITSQTANPQYTKSSHNQNALTRQFSTSQIEKSNAQNIQEFLTSKGFFVMTTGGQGATSNLSYKGYAGFCIKVYIDGLCANDATTGEFDWNSIDLNSIETIEIVDSPSIDETEFAGCVIKITTKNSSDNIKAEFNTTSYETNAFDSFTGIFRYDKKNEKLNYNLGFNINHSQNEFARPEPYGTNFYNFSDNANFNFGWNYKLNSSINIFGNNIFYYNTLKADSKSNLNTGRETDIATRNNINLCYKSDSIESNTSLYYNFSNVKYVNNLLTQDIDNTSFNKISLSQKIKTAHDINLIASIDGEFSNTGKSDYRITERFGLSKNFVFGKKFDETDSSGTRDPRDSRGATTSKTPTSSTVPTSRDSRGATSEVFEKNDNQNFSLEPQLIFLLWQNPNFNFKILPRLNANYKYFSLAVFREIVLPTFNQLYWPETSYARGNKNLKTEEGISAVIGFRKDDLPLWAQYKFSYYGNKIRWLTKDGVMTPDNFGSAFYNTATVGLTFSLFDKMLNFDTNATYISAKLKDTNKQIMWVPEFTFYFSAEFAYKNFSLSANYNYIGKRYTSNENIDFYKPYHLVCVNASYNLSENISIYFLINNLLDCKAIFHDNYFVPSRSYKVGVKFSR